jgi:hypothetical protein
VTLRKKTGNWCGTLQSSSPCMTCFNHHSVGSLYQQQPLEHAGSLRTPSAIHQAACSANGPRYVSCCHGLSLMPMHVRWRHAHHSAQ